jgi:AcrR family transcriptional regulator
MRLRDKQKIDLIHAATLALIARTGLAGLTIPMIAKEAGVAAGTIYIYFKNKEDLILEVYKEVKKRFRSKVFADYSPEKPIKESLRKMWDNLLAWSVANYQEQVFLQQFNVSPYTREKEALSFTKQVLTPLLELIHAGQKQDLIKNDPESLILQLLFGFANQLAPPIHENPAMLTKDFAATTFGYFWDAVRK